MTSGFRANRDGSAYRTWMTSLRNTFSGALSRRIAEEEEEKIDIETISSLNKVEKIHWYIKDNAKQHNTIKFDQIHDKAKPKPVLRRGQAFSIAIRFKERDFDLETDRIILNFKFGPKPSVTKGTMGVMQIMNSKFTRSRSEWDVKIDPGTVGKDLVVQVFIPSDAPVGIWNLIVRCGLQDKSQNSSLTVYEEESECFILFNPWVKDDDVYMENDELREEYVMNDQGKVYVGAHRSPRGRSWAFGQFDDVVLPVACYILELSKFPHSQRGNIIKVVRGIVAGINESDDDGVLSGRWDGEYSDGIAPYKWTGSVRILEEYVKNGFSPVKYGQCWVFSALTTTVCRALGIPCRSVTNFVSAHDTNTSLTIDKFFDEKGDEIEGGPDGNNFDSVWNFHVWNDAWMARNDLPKGYGGWQAIDATPQEESDMKMQCGPASLEAIRRGDIGLAYDCAFLFSEVNADVMHWSADKQSEWGFSRMKINRYHIGRSVLTRKPGEYDDFDTKDREDVVNEYKNAEGSAAERLATHNAIRGCRRARQYYEYKSDTKEDVEFELIEIDAVEVGKDFKIKIAVTNSSEEQRTVSVALTARSIYYTGVYHSIIKKAEGKLTFDPKEQKEIALTIEYSEYWKKLREQCMIKMYAICRVQETGQTWTEEDDFQIEKPKLQIEVPEGVKRKEECEVIFSFTNPLDEPLTDCYLSIDGSGLIRPKTVNIPGSVNTKELFTYKFQFSPRIHGDRKIIASFNSRELFDISGSKSIHVGK